MAAVSCFARLSLCLVDLLKHILIACFMRGLDEVQSTPHINRRTVELLEPIRLDFDLASLHMTGEEMHALDATMGVGSTRATLELIQGGQWNVGWWEGRLLHVHYIPQVVQHCFMKDQGSGEPFPGHAGL